jgi:hypothetical protein
VLIPLFSNKGFDYACGRMTIDDVAEIGRQCLIEYESQLKVKGVRDFGYDAKKFQRHRKCYLPGIELPETVRQPIEDLLQELFELSGFVMSEPEYTTIDKGDLRNVSHNDLRMTFWYAMDTAGEFRLRIICHCYPL